jgi:Fic family protein
MERGITGRYEVFRAGDEEVRAFVPAALPPDPPLDLSGARSRLLERATIAVGRLDSITTLLPDPQLFLYAYVRREAVVSSQIEGTQSSLSDLLLFELDEAPGVPFGDVVEVSNYVGALEHGVARLREGFPLSARLVREMHGALLARGRGSEKAPGEFRRSQNWIGGSRPGNAHFVPTPPALVPEAISALERFLHEEHAAYPVLVTAALAHVQFESIHPFLDANGRIGRLMIPLLLHQAGLLRQPLLYLSLYLKQHRDDYYRLLDRVRATGDWETWLDFFLDGVATTATGAVDTAQRLVGMFADDVARVRMGGRLAASMAGVLQALREHPVLTLNEAARRAKTTFPTASKAMLALVGLGIARELTGYRRNRVFAYDKYLAALSEGAEPLPG